MSFEKCKKCGHAESMHQKSKCGYILKIDDVTLQPFTCHCEHIR